MNTRGARTAVVVPVPVVQTDASQGDALSSPPPCTPLSLRGTAAHLLDTFTVGVRARASLQRRLVGVPLVLGLVLGAAGIALFAMSNVVSIRSFIALQLMFISLPSLLLAVPPTHPAMVNLISVTTPALFFAYSFVNGRTALGLHRNAARMPSCSALGDVAVMQIYVVAAVVTVLPALGMLRGLARRCTQKATAREQLESLWRLLALTYCFATVPMVSLLVLHLAWVPRVESTGIFGCVLANQAVFLVCGAFCANKRLRLRLHAWLAARGEGVHAAAGIATLIGCADPQAAISVGTSRLRAIPAHLLTADVFDARKPVGGWVALSQPAALDGVDCFVSHSWQDDPAAKFAALQAWRAEFVAEHRREPLVWLDRCCIAAADDDLPHLPIFIAACRQLLILAGPTYASRLWCLVECFVFDQMAPQAGTADEATRAALLQLRVLPGCDVDAFGAIDVSRCACAAPEDAERLLAVIDSAYGSAGAFNSRARALLLSMPRVAWEPSKDFAHWRRHLLPAASAKLRAHEAADRPTRALCVSSGPAAVLALLAVALYLSWAVPYSAWAVAPALAECERCEAARAVMAVPGEPGWFFASEAAARSPAGRAFSHSADGSGAISGFSYSARPWRGALAACEAANVSLARPSDAAEERTLQCLLGKTSRGEWLGLPAAGGYARWAEGAAPLEEGATCPELTAWGLLASDCLMAFHYVCERTFPRRKSE